MRVAALRRTNVPRAQLILSQTTKLLQQKQSLESARERLAQIKKSKLQSALDRLAARRRKLVSQLMKIYPITGAPAGAAGAGAGGTPSGSVMVPAASVSKGHDMKSGAGGMGAEQMVWSIRGIRLPSTNLINASSVSSLSSPSYYPPSPLFSIRLQQRLWWWWWRWW
jgi:hypothetical protein